MGLNVEKACRNSMSLIKEILYTTTMTKNSQAFVPNFLEAKEIMYLLQYLLVNHTDFCHIFRLSFAFSSDVMSCNTQIDVLSWLDLQGDHLI